MNTANNTNTNNPLDPTSLIAQRASAAIAAAYPEAADQDPQVAPSKNPTFGDFQINAAMPLAKRLNQKPRDVAAAILHNLKLDDLAEPLTEKSIAGPGFINITLRKDTLANLLHKLDTKDLGLPQPDPKNKQTVVVDLCGVNLAKQTHVGHLRSIIIGDAIAKTLERLGNNVIRQNHVGDWGLPIAMVTRAVIDAQAAGTININNLDLQTLEQLYRNAQKSCSPDNKAIEIVRKYGSHPKALAELEAQNTEAEENLARAKRTLIDLQSHDPSTLAVWQRLVDITMQDCLAICKRLNTDITAEHSAGESSYADELEELTKDLQQRGIAETSSGALVIRNEGIEQPTLVRKGDGGYLYATTDLAAIRRRVQKLGATRVIYCVDARQSLHFQQVFASAIKASYATPQGSTQPTTLQHAAFGMVLGEDGRPFKTRSGENVKLNDLINEAIKLATEQLEQRNTDLPEAERKQVANAVAIAALKYGDLSSERSRDYVFSFSKLIAFEGNTGPYLLYALTRIRSIARKAAEKFGDSELQTAATTPLNIEQPQERALALTLLRYPETIIAAARTLEPHRICQYLYDLAGDYSTFFEHCHVLNAPDEQTRRSRLRLSAITEHTLTDALNILGIPTTLQRM